MEKLKSIQSKQIKPIKLKQIKLKPIEFYQKKIEIFIKKNVISRKTIELWLFNSFITEIIKNFNYDFNFFSNEKEKKIIKIFKEQNKKWENLSKIFPEIIHKKSFKKNVKLNINKKFFSWKWFFSKID